MLANYAYSFYHSFAIPSFILRSRKLESEFEFEHNMVNKKGIITEIWLIIHHRYDIEIQIGTVFFMFPLRSLNSLDYIERKKGGIKEGVQMSHFKIRAGDYYVS